MYPKRTPQEWLKIYRRYHGKAMDAARAGGCSANYVRDQWARHVPGYSQTRTKGISERRSKEIRSWPHEKIIGHIISNGGDIRKTAESLGLSDPTFYRILRDMQVDWHPYIKKFDRPRFNRKVYQKLGTTIHDNQTERQGFDSFTVSIEALAEAEMAAYEQYEGGDDHVP